MQRCAHCGTISLIEAGTLCPRAILVARLYSYLERGTCYPIANELWVRNRALCCFLQAPTGDAWRLLLVSMRAAVVSGTPYALAQMPQCISNHRRRTRLRSMPHVPPYTVAPCFLSTCYMTRPSATRAYALYGCYPNRACFNASRGDASPCATIS